MLPSFVSNLFWGEEDKNDDDETIVNHTLSEAPGDWLIIDCSTGETLRLKQFYIYIIFNIYIYI